MAVITVMISKQSKTQFLESNHTKASWINGLVDS